MATRAVLEEALVLIRDKGWVQNMFYAPGEGYCVMGALMTVANHREGLITRALYYIHQIVGDIGVPAWNDAPGRTKDEVIEVLKEAIVNSPLEEE